MRIKWNAEAEEALERALSALRSGLLVRSWAWAVKAVEALDAATVGVADDQGVGRGQGEGGQADAHKYSL